MIEWIAGGVVAAIIAVIGGLWRARASGRKQAEQQHQRETLERASRNAQERQHVEDSINRGSDSAADQLRERWNRD